MRFRTSLSKSEDGADDRFRWRRGSKAMPYGLWRMERARQAGYVVLVEGESDCHTLWHHGVEALGVPGAGNWKEEWAEHLEGVEKVYAVIEPDEGGEALKEKLTASPALHDRLRLVELDGAKDVSELHLDDPDGFKDELWAACSRAALWSDLQRAEKGAAMEATWQACEELARERRILDRFADTLRRSGVAGESRTAKLLYLALTSRLLGRPVSIAVKGPSSGGKTYLVERVLGYFPESAYHALTAMSERTLAYSEEPIRHRFLVIYEADGMASDFATYLMRSLLSEGKVRYETVESTPQGIRPRLIEREGPTGLILTTTAVKLHPENETRLLSVTVADTRDQTRGVIRALAKRRKEEVDLTPWLALQEWLAGPEAEGRVEIPYAPALAELVPPVAVRLRRDFGAVLNLVRAHAVLHQASRERDGEARVVADLDDYAAIRELVADLIAEGVEATVPKTVRETVEAAKRLLEGSDGEPITTAAVAQELRLDKSAALRRVRSAIDRGHLKNLEDRKGRPARIVLGDPLAGEVEVLPAPERFAEQIEGCRVAGNSGGRDTPLPPHTAPVYKKVRMVAQGRRVHALVAEALLEDLAGIEPTEDAPECVLVGDLGRGFDYTRLNAAFRRLMDGVELVALQKNRFWWESGELSLDAGAFVAALEYASGKEATVVGKPDPPFFAAALEDMGLVAREVAMVGDDAESDVVGARRAGLVGVQVRTGKYRPGTESDADLVVESFAGLPEALGL